MKQATILALSMIVLCGLGQAEELNRWTKYGYSEDDLCNGEYIRRLGSEIPHLSGPSRRAAMRQLQSLQRKAATECGGGDGAVPGEEPGTGTEGTPGPGKQEPKPGGAGGPSNGSEHGGGGGSGGFAGEEGYGGGWDGTVSGGGGSSGNPGEDDGTGGGTSQGRFPDVGGAGDSDSNPEYRQPQFIRYSNGCQPAPAPEMDPDCPLRLLCLYHHADPFILIRREFDRAPGDDSTCGEFDGDDELYEVPVFPEHRSDAFPVNFYTVIVPQGHVPEQDTPRTNKFKWIFIGAPRRPEGEVALVIPFDEDGGTSVVVPTGDGKSRRVPRDPDNARELARFLTVDAPDDPKIAGAHKQLRRAVAVAIAYDENLQLLDGGVIRPYDDRRFSVAFITRDAGFPRLFVLVSSRGKPAPWPKLIEPFGGDAYWARYYVEGVSQRGSLNDNEAELVRVLATRDAAVQVETVFPAVAPRSALSPSPLGAIRSVGLDSSSRRESIQKAALQGVELDFLVRSRERFGTIKSGSVAPSWFDTAHEHGGAEADFVEVLQQLAIADPSLRVVAPPDATQSVGLLTTRGERDLWGVVFDDGGELREHRLIGEQDPMVWGIGTGADYLAQLATAIRPEREFLREWIVSGNRYVLLDQIQLTSGAAARLTLLGAGEPRTTGRDRYATPMTQVDNVVALGPRARHRFIAGQIDGDRIGSWSDLAGDHRRWLPLLRRVYQNPAEDGVVEVWRGPRGVATAIRADSTADWLIDVGPDDAAPDRAFRGYLEQLASLDWLDLSWGCNRPRRGKPDLDAIVGGSLAADYTEFCWHADPLGLFDRARAAQPHAPSDRVSRRASLESESRSGWHD